VRERVVQFGYGKAPAALVIMGSAVCKVLRGAGQVWGARFKFGWVGSERLGVKFRGDIWRPF
jgi:hypothetical protein